MKKLVILQTSAPDYRKKLYMFIAQQLKQDFNLYSGKHYFEDSVKTDFSIGFINEVNNIFFFKNKFLYQTGKHWREVFKDNILVLEMNPRIISNWLILLIRKIINKKTVLWGHAWPRSGMGSKSDKLRHLMRLLGSKIIVYTETQQKELSSLIKNKPLAAAVNAVYYKKEMQCNAEGDIENIIYVGRLTKQKKPLFLLKGYHQALDLLPKTSKLFFVGEGEEKEHLSEYIATHNLQESVKLFGHISDYNILKSLYDTSILSVSPGYVGLSITQSFSFGVPMLVSKTENHSPEIEAVIESENSMFFETDNINDFSKQLLKFYDNKKFWISQREKICVYCKNKYSIESMGKTFIDLIK